jgi:hypothetical protein
MDLSNPTLLDRRLPIRFLLDRQLALAVAAILFLVYGVELTGFTLSIDEEVHTYSELYSAVAPSWKLWVSQGRWGMGLLTYLLPPFYSLPFLATLLFMATLGIGTLLLASQLCRTRGEALIFSGFFATFPVWPHLAEFNTLSWGVGIGVIAVAAAGALVRSGRRGEAILAGLCIGFALGIYQSLLVLYGLILLVSLVRADACWAWSGDPTRSLASGDRLRAAAISLGVALLFYWVAQQATLAISGTEIGYIQGFLRLGEVLSDPLPTIRDLVLQLIGTSGRRGLFLGWGWQGMLLPTLGLAVGMAFFFGSAGGPPLRRLIGAAALAAALVATLGLSIASAGGAPVRSMVPLPFLIAILAINAWRLPARLHPALWAAFALALFVNAWVSVSLFYADDLARQRDLALGTRVMERIGQARDPADQASAPVAFVGNWQHPNDGPAQRKEVFGTSFFSHNWGEVRRILAYLRTIGLDGVHPAQTEEVVGRLGPILALPQWPAPGSVARIDGLIVVKLGPPTPPQRAAWGLAP